MPKLVSNNWKEWKDSFSELLMRIIRKNEIPLSHTIREDINRDYDEVCNSIKEQLIVCIVLTRPNAKGDKATQYSLLYQYLKDTNKKSTIECYT